MCLSTQTMLTWAGTCRGQTRSLRGSYRTDALQHRCRPLRMPALKCSSLHAVPASHCLAAPWPLCSAWLHWPCLRATGCRQCSPPTGICGQCTKQAASPRPADLSRHQQRGSKFCTAAHVVPRSTLSATGSGGAFAPRPPSPPGFSQGQAHKGGPPQAALQRPAQPHQAPRGRSRR